MRSNRMREVTYALTVFITLFGAGCASTKTLTQRYTTHCAWCKAQVANILYYYDYNDGGGTVFKGKDYTWVYKGQTQHGNVRSVPLGQVQTWDKAKQLMIKDNLSNAYRSNDGFYFCSLRCMNAYLASKGVKEDRIRIIPHE